jgi:hypothetical protein
MPEAYRRQLVFILGKPWPIPALHAVVLLLFIAGAGCDSSEPIAERATLRINGSPGGAVDIFRSPGASSQVPALEELIPLGAVVAGRTYSFPAGAYYAVNGCSAMFFQLQANETAVLNLQRAVLQPKQSFRFEISDGFGQGPLDSSSRSENAHFSERTRALWDRILPQAPAPSDAIRQQDQAVSDGVSLGAGHGASLGASPGDAFVESLSRRVLAAPALIPTECVHPLTGLRQVWQDRTQFDLLPGQVTLMVGGRTVFTDFLRNEETVQSFNLLPVVVSAPGELISTRYFSQPVAEGSSVPLPTVSAPVGHVMWLLPGSYRLEVNGTHHVVNLSEDKGEGLSLGTIVVRSPKSFPMQERIRLGGQPIFAFINDGVLFNLDQPYLVFPGTYDVSIEGSDVRGDFSVQSGEILNVQTHGVVVRTPPCPDAQACKPPPRITIHSGRRPFALMHVDTDVPFLLLDQPYEYGVEGIRGVLKALVGKGDELEVEVLSRARINWQLVKGPARVRTDLVRLESFGNGLFGKSLDLLFSRPTEIYVPSGLYELSFFVGEPSQERKKTKQQVLLPSGKTVTLTVPLYSDKVTPAPLSRSGDEEGTQHGLQSEQAERPRRLPTQLQPLN